jgi:glutathione synthase
MNLLFVADPLESFQVYKDTTFAMMREARRRGRGCAAKAKAARARGGAWLTRSAGKPRRSGDGGSGVAALADDHDEPLQAVAGGERGEELLE